MFEEQKVEVRAGSLDDLSVIILTLKDMGNEFKGEASNHEYDLVVDHDKLLAGLHLYKIDMEELDDITAES